MRHRGLAVLLLMLALWSRALIPSGYMPERTGTGAIAVSVCGSDRPWLIPLGGKKEQPDKRHVGEPCAFAALSSAAAPPAQPVALPSHIFSADAFTPASYQSALASPVIRRPPARGPPMPA